MTKRSKKGCLLFICSLLIVICSLVGCAPKKTAEQAAQEAKIAELQAALDALAAEDKDGAAADEPARRERRERRAALQTELAAAQPQTAPQAANPESIDGKFDLADAMIKSQAGKTPERDVILAIQALEDEIVDMIEAEGGTPEQWTRLNILDDARITLQAAYRAAQPQTPTTTAQPQTPSAPAAQTPAAQPSAPAAERPNSHYFPGVAESQIQTYRITNGDEYEAFLRKGEERSVAGLTGGLIIDKPYLRLIVEGNYSFHINHPRRYPDWPAGCTITITGRGSLSPFITLNNNTLIIVDDSNITLQVVATNKSKVEMRSGTLNQITLRGASSFTMSGGVVTLLQHVGGGASCVSVGEGSSFTMTGGAIRGTSHSFYGVRVEGANSSFAMRGGTISGNLAGGVSVGARPLSGGVTASGTGGSFTMSAGTISGNGSDNWADAGVGVGDGGSFAMSGGTISGNRTMLVNVGQHVSVMEGSYGGGGVNLFNATFTMTGGSISGNTSQKGGGIAIGGTSTVNISGGSISGNTATKGNGWGHNVCYMPGRITTPETWTWSLYYRDSAVGTGDRLAVSASASYPSAAGQTLNGWTRKEDEVVANMK